MKRAEITKEWAQGTRWVVAQYLEATEKFFPSKNQGQLGRCMRSHEIVSDLERIEVSEFHDVPNVAQMPPNPYKRGQMVAINLKSLERTKYGPRGDGKIVLLDD